MSRLKIPVMDFEPSLWGTLPNELLLLVFARLPIARIGQLRVLSKEWKRNVDCKESEFNQVFDVTSHLNNFALISYPYSGGTSCDIYDVHADKSHVYKNEALLTKTYLVAGADGGLVCFVLAPMYKRDPRIFIVMNPLTKQKTQLPPLLYMGPKKSLIPMVRMVKFTMDKKTKEYKVFVVVNYVNGDQRLFAQIYDSHIKEWMVVKATQGYIIGFKFLDFNQVQHTFYVYICVDGVMYHINEINITPGFKVERGCCVLIEDHLFVLHKGASQGFVDPLEANESMLQKNCIFEFHLLENTTTWVKLGVHSCVPCKFLLDHTITFTRLWGCKGFLVVYDDGLESAWLYNMSTCEWHIFPAFGKLLYDFNPLIMCTISWNAIA